LTRQHQCGIVADPDDASQVVQEVRHLLQAPERLENMRQRARKLARSYDRLSELRKAVEVIEEAARANSGVLAKR
jgi:UDP-N-acetylglucosamine:LPS N-acetylglucosamine transferase